MRRFELETDSSRRVEPAFFAPRVGAVAAGGGAALVDPAGGCHVEIPPIELIAERPGSLVQKYRHLCWWRQVVNADNN